MSVSQFPTFAHRPNPDGTFDSICRKCVVTIASRAHEAELLPAEREHACSVESLEHLRDLIAHSIHRNGAST